MSTLGCKYQVVDRGVVVGSYLHKALGRDREVHMGYSAGHRDCKDRKKSRMVHNAVRFFAGNIAV